MRVAVDMELDREVSRHVEAGRFLEAVEFLARSRAESLVQERVAREIRRVEKPGRLHGAIVTVPFSGIVTTNYDLLLTVADHARRFGVPVTQRTVRVHEHLLRSFLVHVHGHVDEPSSIVFSRSGYDQIVAPEGSVARQFLFSMFGVYTVLFIGLGFRDQDVDALLRDSNRLGATGGSTVYALVPAGAEIDRVVDVNLRARGINPIYVAEGADYGAKAVESWLSELGLAVEAIAASRSAPVRASKTPFVISSVETIFRSPEWREVVAEVVAGLERRLDLRNTARAGLSDGEISRLFDELSADELRTVLVTMNQRRRTSALEDLLSCFPPALRAGPGLERVS